MVKEKINILSYLISYQSSQLVYLSYLLFFCATIRAYEEDLLSVGLFYCIIVP
jgi:hypothetical protein